MGRISFLFVCVGEVLFLLFPGSLLQAEVTCGTTITEEVTLANDLTCETTVGLIVEGPVGQLNLGGHTISCTSAQGTNGILLLGENARLTNGNVTNCQFGVLAADQGQHRIVDIASRNHSSAGFTTRGIGMFVGSDGNVFISNNAGQSTIGFLITGKKNFLFNNSSVAAERGFVVNHKQNLFTLNVAKGNDIGFSIQLGAEENHFIKNLAEKNAFVGFEIEGNRNNLVKNRAIRNGRNLVDTGFRIVDAHGNFLAFNQSQKNTGMGFEVLGLFARSTHNVLRGNLAQHNHHIGFALQLLAENNTVFENTATANKSLDVQDANPKCDGNTWMGNTFVISDQLDCIH